jgi:hypothetical protein
MTICKQALDLAIEIEGVADRWNSLAALGPAIPERLMPAFLDAVHSLKIDGRKADVFSVMLDRLPPEAHDEVWRTTISGLSGYMPIRYSVGTKLAQSNISLSPELRERLLPMARAIKEPEGRARALAALAFRMPDELQQPVWREVIDATRMVQHPEMAAVTSQKAGTWLDVLPLMPAALAADVWNEALESTLGMFNDHHGLNFDLFCDLVEILPSDLLREALDSARKGEIKPTLAKRLVNIGRRLGGEKQKALLTEAVLAAQQLEDSSAVAEAIGAIGPQLHSDAASRRIEEARTPSNKLARFTALQGLARGLHKEEGISVWEEALNLVVAHHSDDRYDDWATWLALRNIISHVPNELLHRLLEIGLNMRHSEARAKTLAEIAERFSDRQARLIWQQVVNASASAVGSLGLALSNSQPDVPPEKLVELWKGILEGSISIKESYSRNLAIKGLAPYLPSSLSVIVMDYTDHMEGIMEEMDKIDILTSLVPNLSAELFPRFISIAHESSKSWAISRLLGALSSRFSDDQKDTLLDQALTNLEYSDSDFTRSYGLEGIAPNLSGKFTDRALAIALAISDPRLRASALIALGDALPDDAAIEALHSVSLVTEWSTRVRLLGEVATLLATKCRTSPVFAKDSYGVWAETLRVLSLYGRNDLLQGISALVPWLATFATSQDFDQMLDGILETRCSWS